MQNLSQIAKFSAKRIFKDLQKKSPFFCPVLNVEVKVTKLFFQHIAYQNGKSREYREIIERLLLIPFLEEIITTGAIEEIRKEENIIFYEISKPFKKWVFSIIIIERFQQKDFVLLSGFNNYKKKPCLSLQ